VLEIAFRKVIPIGYFQVYWKNSPSFKTQSYIIWSRNVFKKIPFNLGANRQRIGSCFGKPKFPLQGKRKKEIQKSSFDSANKTGIILASNLSVTWRDDVNIIFGGVLRGGRLSRAIKGPQPTTLIVDYTLLPRWWRHFGTWRVSCPKTSLDS